MERRTHTNNQMLKQVAVEINAWKFSAISLFFSHFRMLKIAKDKESSIGTAVDVLINILKPKEQRIASLLKVQRDTAFDGYYSGEVKTPQEDHLNKLFRRNSPKSMKSFLFTNDSLED
ncbi:hypothetical protein M0811_02046 [Anaeramoeba ignava]|uniref:Uncharacterized protein n=1 Tax=Anaeramoeba ignava TaxID=1746090 RepID=A0A9Q0R7G8_ANAIG|nr:hypothetical protein M0811_02046 [Anaeramoeba ignava]